LLGRRRELRVRNIRAREGIIWVDKSWGREFGIPADCVSAGIVRLLFLLRQNRFAVNFTHLVV
jgi:hypothetical protein